MLSVYAFGFLVTDKVGCIASVAPVSEVTSLLPKRMSDLLSSPRASVIFFSVASVPNLANSALMTSDTSSRTFLALPDSTVMPSEYFLDP